MKRDEHRGDGNRKQTKNIHPLELADEGEVRDEITGQMRDRDDAADIALAAVDELADRATEMDVLQRELDVTKEQLLRKAAEFQNYRRRTEEEKGQLVTFGKSLVIQQVLDIVDDFERSIAAAEQAEQQLNDRSAAYEALRQGVEMVHRKLMEELKKLGVDPIEAVGQPFDEHLHEAMLQQPAPDGTDPGVVLDELQRGYRMGSRVLRHSKVIVSA
jgi:molecular chaperone GrpE